MINIDEYIVEKLKLDSEIHSVNNNEEIMPDSPDAEELCDKYNNDKDVPWKLLTGMADGGGPKHFFLRTNENVKISEPVNKASYIYGLYLKDIAKYLGHLYIVVSKYSAIDTSSRINNLKRTYYEFYFGSHGEVFNDKKDANTFLRASRNNPDCGLNGSYNKTFKVMTIKEASEIERSSYGNSIGDIKFRLEL